MRTGANKRMQLVSERWPKLKKQVQDERNPEKLIALVKEIEELLFNLEMRMICENLRKADPTRGPDGEDTRVIRNE
jgi:hypothetical protein